MLAGELAKLAKTIMRATAGTNPLFCSETRLLPKNAFEKGSLLQACYRVTVGGGEAIDGVFFTGGFPYVEEKVVGKVSSAASLAAQKRKETASETAKRRKQEIEEENDWGDGVVKRPRISNVAGINVSCFDSGVRRNVNESDGENSWSAILPLGGNDYVIGSSKSQVEAALMHDDAVVKLNKERGGGVKVREALNFVRGNGIKEGELVLNRLKETNQRPQYSARGKHFECENVKFSELISSIDENIPINHSFSLHNWAVGLMKFQTYEAEQRAEEEVEEDEDEGVEDQEGEEMEEGRSR